MGEYSNSVKWPRIFSDKNNIKSQFIEVCKKQYLEAGIKIGLDRNLPVISKMIGESNYAIWNGGPSVLQSAWNAEQTIKGAGFVSPYEIQNIEKRNFLGASVNIPWKKYKTSDIKSNPIKTTIVNGKFIGFHTWWHDNYGHILHDNIPYLAWLISNFDEEYKIILLKGNVKQEIIKEISIELYNRILWVDIGEVVKINGELVVSIPDVFPTIMGENFMPYFKDLMGSASEKSNEQNDVIFYTRNGTTNKRVLNLENENQVIGLIKQKMKEFNINGELKIFSGMDENKNILPIRTQIEIFKNAHTVIGPHGSGLVNFVWSDLDKVKILEFVPSVECGSVQRPFNGYHNVFHGLNLDYNHILYTDDSTTHETKIDLNDFKNALNTIWG
jgi:capsular polysaccharide biosynthesis protein